MKELIPIIILIVCMNELVKKDDALFTEKPENLQKKLIELENFPAVFGSSVLNRATN